MSTILDDLKAHQNDIRNLDLENTRYPAVKLSIELGASGENVMMKAIASLVERAPGKENMPSVMERWAVNLDDLGKAYPGRHARFNIAEIRSEIDNEIGISADDRQRTGDTKDARVGRVDNIYNIAAKACKFKVAIRDDSGALLGKNVISIAIRKARDTAEALYMKGKAEIPQHSEHDQMVIRATNFMTQMTLANYRDHTDRFDSAVRNILQLQDEMKKQGEETTNILEQAEDAKKLVGITDNGTA